LQWLEGAIAIGATVVIQLAVRFLVVEAYKIPASSMVPTFEEGDHIMVEKLSRHWRAPARADVIVFRQPCEPDRDYVKRVIAQAGDTVEIRCNTVYVRGVALASHLVQGEGCRYNAYDESRGEWYSRECSEYTETADDRTYRVYHDPDRPKRDERAWPQRRGDAKDFPLLDRDRVAPSCASSSQFGEASTAAPRNQQPGSLVETTRAADPCEQQLHYVVPPGHVFVLGDSRANSNDSRYWGSVPIENIKGRVVGIWWGGGPSGMNVQRFGGID